MVDIDATIEQVAGILHRADLEFQTHPDGDAFRVPFGSTAVFVNFSHWRDGVCVTLTAPVLSHVAADSPGAAIVQTRLNDLNADLRFMKFVFKDETLMAATDLLGDRLSREALLNSLYAMAAAAEQLGDAMVEEVGGLRVIDFDEEEDVFDEVFEDEE